MIDLEKSAETLYGEDSQAKPVPKPESLVEEEEADAKDPAEVLFGKDGEEPEEETEEAAEDEASSVPATEDEVVKVLGDMGYEADGITDVFKEFIGDAKLTKDHVMQLVAIKEEQDAKTWERISESWKRETMNAFSLDEIDSAKKAFNRFGDDALKELFRKYELGNHPAVMRLFVNLADEWGY